MVREQENSALKKEEMRRAKKAKLNEQKKRDKAAKKIRTMWNLQKRIESQSRQSLLNLRTKYRFVHERLRRAVELKEACFERLSGRKEIDINNPVGFLNGDSLPEELNNIV